MENNITSESKFSPDIWAGIPSEVKRTTDGTESMRILSNSFSRLSK